MLAIVPERFLANVDGKDTLEATLFELALHSRYAVIYKKSVWIILKTKECKHETSCW